METFTVWWPLLASGVSIAVAWGIIKTKVAYLETQLKVIEERMSSYRAQQQDSDETIARLDERTGTLLEVLRRLEDKLDRLQEKQ